MFKRFINLILPVECGGCGGRVNPKKINGLCSTCFKNIEVLNNNCCNYCGKPVKEGLTFCPKCWEMSSYTDRFLTACYYRGPIKNIIKNLKYKNRGYLANILSEILFNRYSKIVKPEFDLIVPVPLHAGKLEKRGYNQAALIAKNLSKKTKIPLANSIVKRVKTTKPQYQLTRKERIKNLKNAFRSTKILHGERVLLIDDVATTGSTVQNCASVIVKAGSGKVSALVIAHGK